MIKKISAALLVIAVGLFIFIVKIDIAGAANLTTDADNVDSLIEITDIVENEIQKSTDSTKFDIFYTVADSNFLWSPDGSKLLILAHRNMATKGDPKRVPCGEFGLHERASTLFWIYTDGSEVTNIARAEESIRAAKNNTAAFLDSAWWSSNGDKVVFTVLNPCDEKNQKYVSDRNGSIEVDNSTVKQLTLSISAAGYQNDIKYSPDGEKIAFIGNKDGNVYTVDVDNSSIQQLTTDMEVRGLTWKPDGKKLVFVAVDGLYVINAEGSNLKLIEKENFSLGLWSIGSWSPDGKKLLFTTSDVENQNFKLQIFDIDALTARVIDAKWASQISWSPYGDKIAFRSDMSSSLYIVNSDGTDKITLSESYSARVESGYVWGMDNKIYYLNNDSIVKIKPDGTERLLLVKNIPTDVYNSNKISLSSDGSRIVFTTGSLKARERTYILKMKGYDEVMSIYAPNSIKQGDAAFVEVNSMSKPVENAVISLNGMEIGKTNETGVLKYSFKEAGNYRLSAIKQGFKTANKSITIKEQSSEKSPEQTMAITTSAPTATADAPKTSGFSLLFAGIMLIVSVFLIKRWRA